MAIKVELVGADKAPEVLERVLKIRNPVRWPNGRRTPP